MFKKIFFIPLLFFSLAMAHLIINAQIIYTGYEIDGLKNKLNKIRPENRYLSAISAQKKDLGRIESQAIKIGMVLPQKVYFITAEASLNK